MKKNKTKNKKIATGIALMGMLSLSCLGVSNNLLANCPPYPDQTVSNQNNLSTPTNSESTSTNNESTSNTNSEDTNTSNSGAAHAGGILDSGLLQKIMQILGIKG